MPRWAAGTGLMPIFSPLLTSFRATLRIVVLAIAQGRPELHSSLNVGTVRGHGLTINLTGDYRQCYQSFSLVARRGILELTDEEQWKSK